MILMGRHRAAHRRHCRRNGNRYDFAKDRIRNDGKNVLGTFFEMIGLLLLHAWMTPSGFHSSGTQTLL